jgi:hypothetical protein
LSVLSLKRIWRDNFGLFLGADQFAKSGEYANARELLDAACAVVDHAFRHG